MKKMRLLLLAAFLLPLAASGQSDTQSERPWQPTTSQAREMSEQYRKITDFYRMLTGNYLDTVDYSAIVESGIRSMLAQLDPHSVYLTARDRQASMEELGGGFSGIGVEFNTLNDTIIVVNTVSGGPAERVGLAPNDRIVTINGVDVVGLDRADVPKRLRGARGTKVTISVVRRGVSGKLDFILTRDDIPLNTVDAAYMLDGQTGYIRVNRFGATTSREFADAFAKLRSNAGSDSGSGGGSQPGTLDGLILDLRGNGGGFLPEAIRMSEFFLDRDRLIVSTEGNMYPRQTYTAQRTGPYNAGRLIVLVDESSASASEIVTGAVQDWDRGIIVGRTTFGKGLVQREFPLLDDSAVRLTVARYLTPTGRAIQRPYESGRAADYYRQNVLRRVSGASVDTISGAAQEYRTLLTARRVYGGGGIRPDIVIEADTTGYSAWWAALVRSGVIREFAHHYLDGNRERIVAEYPDVESYLSRFDASELLIPLADYAASHGVERDEQGLETSREWLSSQLKALLAQSLWDTTAFYRVAHATYDDMVRAAHAMMTQWRAENDGRGAADRPAPVSDELVRRLAAAVTKGKE